MLDGDINTDDRYNYALPYADQMNEHQTVGIDLSSDRELEDTGQIVPLNGPLVNSFTAATLYYGQVANLGADFIDYKLNSSPTSNLLRFVIDGDESANLKGRIMRVD